MPESADPLIKELDLGAIQEPEFRIKLKPAPATPDNPNPQPVVMSYEPFTVMEKLAKAAASPTAMIDGSIAAAQALNAGAALPTQPVVNGGGMFDDIRAAFRLPDISGYYCVVLMLEVRKHIAKLQVTQEMDALAAKDAEKDAKK